MSYTEPLWVINDAKRIFPQATFIDLKFSNEVTYGWQRLDDGSREWNNTGFEAKWDLTVQERANVVGDFCGLTLNEIAAILREHESCLTQ